MTPSFDIPSPGFPPFPPAQCQRPPWFCLTGSHLHDHLRGGQGDETDSQASSLPETRDDLSVFTVCVTLGLSLFMLQWRDRNGVSKDRGAKDVRSNVHNGAISRTYLTRSANPHRRGFRCAIADFLPPDHLLQGLECSLSHTARVVCH